MSAPFGDPRPPFVAGGNFNGNANVLARGEFGKYLGDLKSASHPSPHPPLLRQTGDILAVEDDAPGTGRQESAHQIEESGLSGAVRTDDGAQFTGGDIHRNAVDSNEASEVARDVLYLKQVHDTALRRMRPRTPRGKNMTTSTKNNPMNDIQLSVWLEI